jgi:hypothetical protein
MDRTRAWENIGTGLLIAAIAIGVFGLTFFVTLLYING